MLPFKTCLLAALLALAVTPARAVDPRPSAGGADQFSALTDLVRKLADEQYWQ